MSTKVIQLIYTDEVVGDGTEEKPMQRVARLFTLDGECVAKEFADFQGTNLKQFYPDKIKL